MSSTTDSPGEPNRDRVADLERLAQSLNLTSLTRDPLKSLLEQSLQQGISYSDFATRLLETEIRARRDRKLTRILKRSRLDRELDTLDTFDFTKRPKLRAASVRELLDCRWIEEARNIICVGRPGLGKTRILKALGRAACEKGFDALYVVTAKMLEDLQTSLADGTYRRVLRRYERPSVLLCDEFGNEPFDSRASNFLFRLVSARHRKAPTVIATNTGFSSWRSIFPSEAQAVATVDRLIDNASILNFTGKSWRAPRDGSLDNPED
jgi:DNA replication protein DnaC